MEERCERTKKDINAWCWMYGGVAKNGRLTKLQKFCYLTVIKDILMEIIRKLEKKETSLVEMIRKVEIKSIQVS